MIVVDTNVMASLWLSTAQSDNAEKALARDPEWSAPLLWRSELRNVLASALRADLLSLDHAVEIARSAESLLAAREFGVPSADVLAAAARTGCSAYDCEFAVLARGLGVKLVSLDRKLVRAFPDLAVPLQEYAA